MYLGCLEAFAQRQGWENGRQTLCHHTLSTSRRAYHDKVVTTRSSNLHGALHGFLSFDIGKVKLIFVLSLIELLTRINFRRLNSRRRIVQQIDNLLNVVRTINFQVIHHCRLTHILLGNNQPLIFLCTSHNRYWQSTSNWQERAVETQLTYHHKTGQTIDFYLPGSCHNANGNRQIVGRTFFLQIGRRKVHRYALHRETITTILYGCYNSLVALLNCIVGQSH